MTFAFRLLKRERELFFVTPFKSPKPFRLVAYRAVLPMRGQTVLVGRVCGVPGDVVEIKSGVLFVNGRAVDGELRLKHIYKINQQEAAELEYKEEEAYTIPPYTDTLYVPLEDRVVKKEQLSCTRYILPAGLRDDEIYRVYQKSWNVDNFGPLRIPSKKLFLLGDNRGKAQDSRHLGLIDENKVVGTVLWK
jgi:signal peptidase I